MFKSILQNDVVYLGKFIEKMKKTTLVKSLFGDLGYEIDDTFLKETEK